MRAGHCYSLAGRHLLDHPGHGGALVHGSVQLAGGKRLLHAWVDEGPVIGVYEPENDQHFSQADFAGLFSPREHVRTERDEALATMLRKRTWGPWQEACAEHGVMRKSSTLSTGIYPGYWHYCTQCYCSSYVPLSQTELVTTPVMHHR